MEQHFDGTDAAYERRQAATPIPKNTRDLLAEPRELFRTFEAKMGSPEGLIHLSEALSQLIDIAEDASSTELKQTCSTMVSTYALRVQARVQLLLTQSPAHQETLAHWCTVFSEFTRSGFALPSQVTECSVNLLFKRYFGETLDEMSPSQREKLFKLLQDRIAADESQQQGQER